MSISSLTAVAHRGYSALYPENTKLSFKAAIAAGSPVIESDARLTQDGKVIAFHDPDLIRLGGIDRLVEQTSSNEIRSLDIGRGEPPAFLSEVLDLARDKVMVLIDMKLTDLKLTQAVLDIVDQKKMNSAVIIGARSLEQLKYQQDYKPEVRCLGLVGDYDEIPQWLEMGAYAIRSWEEDLNHPAVSAILGKNPVWVTAGYRSQGEIAGQITRTRLDVLLESDIEAVLLNDPSLITGQKVDL